MGLLLLASISRCALSAFCPTDAEIISAVRAWDTAQAQATSDDAAAEGQVVILHPRPIRRVSDVICGAPAPGEAPTIVCRFTVHYAGHDAYQIARLVRRDEAWEVAETLVVTRNRT